MAPMYAYMDLIPTSSPNFTFIVKHLARTAAILVDPPARDWTRCESSSFRRGSPSNTLGKGADLGLLGYDFVWPMEPIEVDRTFEKTQIIQMSNLTSCGCWLCAQKKPPDMLWEDVSFVLSTFVMWSDCRPVACAKSCVDTVGNPAEKSTERCTYHLWPHQKIFISHAGVACISHIQLKTCIRFQSKSSTYHIKVSMFKSSSNTLMIFDVKLQLDAQCRRSEIEFDAVFLYQYLRSLRHSLLVQGLASKVTQKQGIKKVENATQSLKDLDFTMINLPFLRETDLLSSKSQVSQVTYHEQSQLGPMSVACMCYDLQWHKNG